MKAICTNQHIKPETGLASCVQRMTGTTEGGHIRMNQATNPAADAAIVIDGRPCKGSDE